MIRHRVTTCLIWVMGRQLPTVTPVSPRTCAGIWAAKLEPTAARDWPPSFGPVLRGTAPSGLKTQCGKHVCAYRPPREREPQVVSGTTLVRGLLLKWTEVDRSKRGPEVDRSGTVSVHFWFTSGPASRAGRTKWTDVGYIVHLKVKGDLMCCVS